MPMWPSDSSSGTPNMTEDFGDATLWHPCVPWFLPQRQPTTRQPNNEFKNSKWKIGWHDCHFVLKFQFMHSGGTQLNSFDTNATDWILLGQETSALLGNWSGQDQIGSGLWNFVRRSGRPLKIAGTIWKKNYINFHLLLGITDALVAGVHTIGE